MLKRKKTPLICLVLCLVLSLCGCLELDTIESSSLLSESDSVVSAVVDDTSSVESSKSESNHSKDDPVKETSSKTQSSINLNNIPAFSGKAYIVLNNNKPNFTKSMLVKKSYESYSSLDALGRCSVAVSCIGKDIMPTEDRGSIGQVKPSGWQTVKYDIVDGKYLYNRCHLIGYQLTGENANTKNLITGTRYLNIEGMLPFENMVADYIKETGNHVIYRVTPIFKGNNLVASGVQMEGYSVEDNGDGICFNVYCYNVQPGIVIDYATGKSWLKGGSSNTSSSSSKPTTSSVVSSNKTSSTIASIKTYVLNTNTKKVHLESCASAKKISSQNRGECKGSELNSLLNSGYSLCKNCLD